MPISAAPGDQPLLLVVDDDPDMGEFIADVAQMGGYRFRCSSFNPFQGSYCFETGR